MMQFFQIFVYSESTEVPPYPCSLFSRQLLVNIISYFFDSFHILFWPLLVLIDQVVASWQVLHVLFILLVTFLLKELDLRNKECFVHFDVDVVGQLVL